MNESEIYMSLASRFLAGSSAAHGPAHELSGFACYHAFESAGGAWVTHLGGHYPYSHHAKLNQFVAGCQTRRFRHNVAAMAIRLNALRNSFLYPVQNGANWTHPMTVLTASQVVELHRRVAGIVNAIRGHIR